MTDEALRQMQENVAAVRAHMDAALKVAGRTRADVKLCAASKTREADIVLASAGLDIDLFGENHVQELVAKCAANAYGTKPHHFIGHLQSNKVKQVVGIADVIESVDSEKLLRMIDAEAQKRDITQHVLLEVNLGGEVNKSGVAKDALPGLLTYAQTLANVRVCGLMTVPPVCDDSRPWFMEMRSLFEKTAAQFGAENICLQTLSMGMSGDFAAAIAEGSTEVRVGTAIYGARDYSKHA